MERDDSLDYAKDMLGAIRSLLHIPLVGATTDQQNSVDAFTRHLNDAKSALLHYIIQRGDM